MKDRKFCVSYVKFLFTVVFCSFSSIATSAEFKEELILKVLSDGTNFVVQKEFMYVDSNDVKWVVPIDSITDGASVPRALWSLFPPLNGKYLRAAVVHDRFCQTRDKPWRDVHRLFYEAMLTAGVNPTQAKVMYSAVFAFGPRWDVNGADRAIELSGKSEEEQKQAIEYYERWVRDKDPSLEMIEEDINEKGIR